MNYLVILDDGHGNDTAGKRTPLFPDKTFMKENEFNSDVVNLIYNKLQKINNVDVFLTAPEKYDVPLNVRIERANKSWEEHQNHYGKNNSKCILISVHANAFGDGSSFNTAKGVSVYCCTTPPEEEVLARAIHSEIRKGTSQYDRGINKMNFIILRGNMTSCLVECAFMTNLEEGKLLKTDEFREECATEIVQGICNYFKINNTSISKPISDKPTVEPAPNKPISNKPTVEPTIIKPKDKKIVAIENAYGTIYQFETKSNVKTTYGVSPKDESVRFIKIHPDNFGIFVGRESGNGFNSGCRQAFNISQINGFGTNGTFFGTAVWNMPNNPSKKQRIWSNNGILAVDGTVLCPYACHAPAWTDKSTWYPQGCLVAYKDGTFDIVIIKNISEIKKPYYWVVSGISLYPTFAPEKEGFVGAHADVLRFTDHTSMGITADGMIILARSYRCHRRDTIKQMVDLGCVKVIGLDSGGSTQYRVPDGDGILQRPSSSYNMRLVPNLMLATDLA